MQGGNHAHLTSFPHSSVSTSFHFPVRFQCFPFQQAQTLSIQEVCISEETSNENSSMQILSLARGRKITFLRVEKIGEKKQKEKQTNYCHLELIKRTFSVWWSKGKLVQDNITSVISKHKVGGYHFKYVKAIYEVVFKMKHFSNLLSSTFLYWNSYLWTNVLPDEKKKGELHVFLSQTLLLLSRKKRHLQHWQKITPLVCVVS